jgi:hypothetical protein
MQTHVFACWPCLRFLIHTARREYAHHIINTVLAAAAVQTHLLTDTILPLVGVRGWQRAAWREHTFDRATILDPTAIQAHLLAQIRLVLRLAFSLTLRRGTIPTARREHTFDRPTILAPTAVHAHLLAHISSRVVTRVCVALLLLHLVRQKDALYAIESSLRHYLKYVLTSPATTCVRADAPLEPVSLAVHRALVLIAGLWQRKGAI